MPENRIGHFGLPGLLVAIGGLLTLVLHLAVPYAHVNYREDGQDSETITRGEAADIHDDNDLVGASAPGVTLAGSIILLVAGAGLLILGFVPMGVSAARWTGWGLGLVATVGGMMAFMSSLFWVGSGFGLAPLGLYGEGFSGFGGFDFGGASGFAFFFGGLTGGITGLVEIILNTGNAGTVIIIGPILTALTSALGILTALTVCSNVISSRDGLRERASRHLSNARLAMVALAIVLLMPWSIGKVTDYEGDGDRDPFVFGAHTILNANEFDDGTYDAMTYALNVMIAAAWIGVLLGAIGSLGGVLASENAPPVLARAFHYTAFGTLFMTGYAALVYVLAWIYMWKPSDGADDFQPGYGPILLLPILVFWAIGQVRLVRANLQRQQAARQGAERKVVTFD